MNKLRNGGIVNNIYNLPKLTSETPLHDYTIELISKLRGDNIDHCRVVDVKVVEDDIQILILNKDGTYDHVNTRLTDHALVWLFVRNNLNLKDTSELSDAVLNAYVENKYYIHNLGTDIVLLNSGPENMFIIPLAYFNKIVDTERKARPSFTLLTKVETFFKSLRDLNLGDEADKGNFSEVAFESIDIYEGYRVYNMCSAKGVRASWKCSRRSQENSLRTLFKKSRKSINSLLLEMIDVSGKGFEKSKMFAFVKDGEVCFGLVTLCAQGVLESNYMDKRTMGKYSEAFKEYLPKNITYINL